MDLVGDIGSILLFAQETAGEGGGEEGGGSFLVSPEIGLMVWTLLLFGATLLILNKLVFPRISEALDRRSKAIEESIEHAERTKREADELLEEYRARLPGRPGEGRREQAARGAARRDAARHRGRDAPRARRDPQGGRGPHRDRDREGHPQVAHARRPPPPDRGSAARGGLLSAGRAGGQWKKSLRSTRARCSRSPGTATSSTACTTSSASSPTPSTRTASS